MQRSRQSAVNGVHRMQIGERRMLFSEFFKMFEHRRNDGVHGVVGHLGRGDEGGHHPKRADRVAIGRIGPPRDGGVGEIGVVDDQSVDRWSAQGNQAGVAGLGRLEEIGRRTADDIAEAVDPCFAQGLAVLVR